MGCTQAKKPVVCFDQSMVVVKVPVTDLVMIEPASAVADGFVIFKMRETGYFVVADR